jgi:hypothetical protein
MEARQWQNHERLQTHPLASQGPQQVAAAASRHPQHGQSAGVCRSHLCRSHLEGILISVDPTCFCRSYCMHSCQAPSHQAPSKSNPRRRPRRSLPEHKEGSKIHIDSHRDNPQRPTLQSPVADSRSSIGASPRATRWRHKECPSTPDRVPFYQSTSSLDLRQLAQASELSSKNETESQDSEESNEEMSTPELSPTCSPQGSMETLVSAMSSAVMSPDELAKCCDVQSGNEADSTPETPCSSPEPKAEGALSPDECTLACGGKPRQYHRKAWTSNSVTSKGLEAYTTPGSTLSLLSHSGSIVKDIVDSEHVRSRPAKEKGSTSAPSTGSIADLREMREPTPRSPTIGEHTSIASSNWRSM